MRLLIVEDNTALARNLAVIFTQEGYQVSTASSAKEALSKSESGFDLALLDVRLSDLSGTAILPELRARAPDAEIIVMTANADLTTAIDSFKSGAFAYLTKPVITEKLILTVERARERVEMRRREAELQAALAASEKTHREIVANVQALILTIDEGMVIRFANRACEETLGYPEAALLGRDLRELLAPPGMTHEARTLALRTAIQAASQTHEQALLHRDGSSRAIIWRWTSGANPRPGWSSGVGTDVTHLRALEHSDRVRDKLAAVGRLSAGLAHEIKNPLNAAGLQLALVSRLVERFQESERAALATPLDLARSELRRLNQLLEDFLRFARPREYRRQPVALGPLIEVLIANQQQRAAEVGKQISAAIESGASVLGDADALMQVLVNLFNNALDAAERQVVIRLQSQGGQAVLSVEDDGPGIPPEVRARIFEPFFTTKPGGTGLGTAIVHTIVTGHGGEVSYPAQAKGAVARVRIALAPKPG